MDFRTFLLDEKFSSLLSEFQSTIKHNNYIIIFSPMSYFQSIGTST